MADEKDRDPLETTEELFAFLQGEIPEGYRIRPGHVPKLTADQAWTVIWYLGNLYWQVTDHVERCCVCGELYDTHSEGACLDYGEAPYNFCDKCAMHSRELQAKKATETKRRTRMIQRYREDYVNGIVECDDGEFVRTTDHEADKAQAVSKLIKENNELRRAAKGHNDTAASLGRERAMSKSLMLKIDELRGEKERLNLLVVKAVAEAVEKEREKTAEMRAELVDVLSRPIRLHALRQDDWFHVRSNSEDKAACERLVTLGAWEGEWLRECWWKYRPIESQDSGGSDE